jgi:hypothetical protein
MPSAVLTKNALKSAVPMEPAIETFVMGLDIGYGDVKVYIGNGHEIIFPSVAAHASTIKFQSDEILASYPGEQLTDPQTGEEWFVGNLAISQTNPAELIQLQGRDNNISGNMRFRLRMLYAAIAKAYPHQHGKLIKLILSTGLPVDHMADAPALKAALIGRHVIHTNNADMIVDIEIAYVMPQPKGTIYMFMYDEDGALNEEQDLDTVAVFDIGRVTLDGTVDQNGKMISDRSGSTEGGVYTVRNRISDAYEAQFGEKPSYNMIEKILREREAKVSGQLHDFSEMVKEAVAPLRDSVLSFMGRLWKKALEIEAIYVTGGGAELVSADVLSVYSQAIQVQNSQMSNAIGYYRYAMAKLRNRK